MSGNSAASKEVFNIFLISFRDAQMNWRLKVWKKKKAAGSFWDENRLTSEGPRELPLWVTYRRSWGKEAGFLLFLFIPGDMDWASAVQHCLAPTTVNPWSPGSQKRYFPVSFHSKGTSEIKDHPHHGFLHIKTLSSVSGNSRLVSKIGHKCH